MTATTTPSSTHYQDIHSTIPLTPTRCHPTAHSHREEQLRGERIGALQAALLETMAEQLTGLPPRPLTTGRALRSSARPAGRNASQQTRTE
jgi:hypothetical protein